MSLGKEKIASPSACCSRKRDGGKEKILGIKKKERRKKWEKLMPARGLRERYQGSKWIRPEKRQAIYLRDGEKCVYCGQEERLTLDHLRPVQKGGNNGATNLVTCCLSCNSKRGNKSWKAFATEEAIRKIEKTRRRTLPLQRTKMIINL